MPPVNQENQINPQLSEVVKRLTEANNVLVTVSNNPSVDQLAACIGLTIALNKKDKHATAVFSGSVPSTIEFLEPDKTIEKNTDSLRDFIISLDKSKADKLRYKVENDVVKIFITPYRTSISDKDLDFSQGDFNVDAVVALGVQRKEDLDAAIVAHGRILHDATIIAVNINEGGELGSINWIDGKASSLSEMASDLATEIDSSILDSQIATAFLTGIVSETDRFRNEKSSPHTMTVSGKLMSAGASTQLVSSKLEEATKLDVHETKPEEVKDEIPESEAAPKKPDDGMIQIEHGDNIHIDDSGELKKLSELQEELKHTAENPPPQGVGMSLPEPASETEENKIPEPGHVNNGPSIMTEPPKFGGELTANSRRVDEEYVRAPDPLAGGGSSNNLSPFGGMNTTLTHSNESKDERTLTDLERSVNSPHLNDPSLTEPSAIPQTPPSDDARDAVNRAVQAGVDYRQEPIQALGANPLGQIDHQPANGLPPESQPPSSSGPPPPPVPPPLPT